MRTCFDFFLKTITPNLLKFYFYSLKQGRFSLVNQDNMAIESCVIGHIIYCYIKIYNKISCWYVTYESVHSLARGHVIRVWIHSWWYTPSMTPRKMLEVKTAQSPVAFWIINNSVKECKHTTNTFYTWDYFHTITNYICTLRDPLYCVFHVQHMKYGQSGYQYMNIWSVK